MIKAVIFDMFETLVTLFAGPVYMGKQIAKEIGIAESKFREIWNPTDEDRTLGKRTLEDVIEEILRVNNCYFEERDIIKNSILFDYFDVMCMSCELGVKKPDVRIFQKCMEDLGLEPDECLYIGDGGSLELETAETIGMHPLQAAWYLKDELDQPVKRKPEFAQAESPLDVIEMTNEEGYNENLNYQ